MLIADTDTWQQGCVEVERKLARKAGNNARGAIGRDVFSVLHYSKTHYTVGATNHFKQISRKSSVFQNSKVLAPKAK